MLQNEFKFNKKFITERGDVIENLTISYAYAGKLNEDRDNVIWVCHALTANADVESWWPNTVGPGLLLDTDKYFIICANVLGSCYGSSGPLSEKPAGGKYYLDFPKVTIRDMAKAHDILRSFLQIDEVYLCLGGSLGGQQALEWAISCPDIIKNLVLVCSNAFHSPWGIAFNESQRMAIQADPTWNEQSDQAGLNGLAAARAMALLSYRNYGTYNKTQKEDQLDKFDNFKAITYQQYQGQKLVKRFHAHAYLYLSWAMDSHNVGRGRGSVEEAMKMVKAKTLTVGIASDVLFPAEEQKYMQTLIPGAKYVEMDSFYGHDGFLIETEVLTDIIRNFLNSK